MPTKLGLAFCGFLDDKPGPATRHRSTRACCHSGKPGAVRAALAVAMKQLAWSLAQERVMLRRRFHRVDPVPAIIFSVGFLISVIVIWSY